MRLLYLCAVDPPPPQSDGSAVRSFFETLPEYLYPASSDRDSPHKLFFADRVGRSIIMEFFDFAVVFLSKNFLNSENAMACLARAKTAFPNMVCVDLHNNLTAEETSIAARYSKHILSLDEGRQFLISTFPEIAAAYDLQTKELTKSIETDGYEYLDDTISDLEKQKERNYRISWGCYILSLIMLVAILVFAFFKFSKLAFAGMDISLYQTIVLCVEIVVLSIAAVSISRFLFLLGKSFMVESLRNANRAHAIGLGKLYLKLYKGKFKWDELKDVLRNWNIDSGSAFMTLDAKDIEPVSLDNLSPSLLGKINQK